MGEILQRYPRVVIAPSVKMTTLPML